jgi:hypothetical protein
MDHGATYDFCRVALAFDIREGEIDGTSIGGLTVALIADTPKVMTDGNWRLGVFIDAQATDEQAEKLGQVFTGQLGGPMESGEPIRFNGMFHPVGSDLTMAEAKRSRITGFGIEFEGKTGLSKSSFSWAA